MAERFLVLRGTPDGSVHLARPDQPDDVDTWTEDRGGAWRFADRRHADVVRETIVARVGIAVAVVPDQAEATTS